MDAKIVGRRYFSMNEITNEEVWYKLKARST